MANIITIEDAILSLKPNAKFQMLNGNFDNIDWLDTSEEDKCTKAEAETKQAELQAIEDAKPTEKDLKASARAKLIAGEALTEDEANTIVL